MPAEIAKLPETGFVRFSVIRQLIPLSRSTFWKGVREGRFPRPVKVGAASLWRVEDVRACIETLGREG